MRDEMTSDPNEITKLVFKAGQQPASWLRSAGHLRDAAEVILKHELPDEISYSQARKTAEEEVAARIRDGADLAAADIKATAPNYPPAQLLYAYDVRKALNCDVALRKKYKAPGDEPGALLFVGQTPSGGDGIWLVAAKTSCRNLVSGLQFYCWATTGAWRKPK